MNKNTLIIIIVISVFLSFGSSFGVYSYVKGNFDSKLSEKTAELDEIQSQIDRVKSEKDDNQYLPSDVVKNFMTEVKSKAFNRAKLYLTENNQSLDIEKALDLGFPTSSLVTKEVSYEISDQSAVVKYYYDQENQENAEIRKFKEFQIVKVNEVWKISQIKN